jgi:hypothetical protein
VPEPREEMVWSLPASAMTLGDLKGLSDEGLDEEWLSVDPLSTKNLVRVVVDRRCSLLAALAAKHSLSDPSLAAWEIAIAASPAFVSSSLAWSRTSFAINAFSVSAFPFPFPFLFGISCPSLPPPGLIQLAILCPGILQLKHSPLKQEPLLELHPCWPNARNASDVATVSWIEWAARLRSLPLILS